MMRGHPLGAVMAALSLGFPTGEPVLPGFPSRRDWSHITHTISEKPLTKRQKRRLRGKRKAKP